MSCDFDGHERTRALPDASLVECRTPREGFTIFLESFAICVPLSDSSSFCLFLCCVCGRALCHAGTPKGSG